MYIKKDEFKGIKHNLVDENGTMFVIELDTMDNESVYNINKFMFDEVDKTGEEILNQDENDIEKKIEIVKEEQREIPVEKQLEETISENIKLEKNDIKEEIENCSSLKDVHELANENGISLSGVRNLKKLKEELIEKL